VVSRTSADSFAVSLSAEGKKLLVFSIAASVGLVSSHDLILFPFFAGEREDSSL
jgi:hypothetical protein